MRSAEEQRERDLDRLRKLLAAEAAHKHYGSTAEAEAATTIIQELVFKLQLEEGDLERLRGESKPKEMVRLILYPTDYGETLKQDRVFWTETLGVAVAESLFCICLASLTDNVLWVVGKKRDAGVAELMFLKLARTALYLADTEKPQRGSTEREKFLNELAEGIEYAFIHGKTKPDFRESYLVGFATGVAKRLARNTAELERKRLESGGSTYGLILVRDAVEKYAEELTEGNHSAPPPPPELDSEALRKGMLRGYEVNLDGEGRELPSAPEDKSNG